MSREEPALSIVLRRTVEAPAAFLFAAWTEPDRLRDWWGPEGVECCGAEVDLRVGGAYRIGNRYADGREVWISGEFETVDPPVELKFTWRLEGTVDTRENSLVTVRFEERPDQTDVVIIHQRIPDAELQSSHERGWEQCLDGLTSYLASLAI